MGQYIKNILIVKHGALGDVVRTSYLVHAFKKKFSNEYKIYWLTSEIARELISYSPTLFHVVTNLQDLHGIDFEEIFSLDDEVVAVNSVMKLRSKKITGALLDSSGKLTYSDDSSQWFEMGLLSRYPKEQADFLKKNNLCGHAEIFSKIFGLNFEDIKPVFFPSPEFSKFAKEIPGDNVKILGINPYAGGRWPAKELRYVELLDLTKRLLDRGWRDKFDYIYLFGSGHDRLKNCELMNALGSNRVIVADTEESVQKLAAYISRMSYFITSDSLAMHLAIAQNIKTIAYFSPTSAAEIDDFGALKKIISTDPDYCSYLKNCENKSITSTRIIQALNGFMLES